MSKKLRALSVSAARNKRSYQFCKVDTKLLERFKSPNPGQLVCIDCAEFTSLCPVTGQPDFGCIHIEYIPDKWCVESKALKLYLMGFRQFGAFAESCVQRICDDLVALLSPKHLCVTGKFASRGGIAIHPTSSYKK